MFLWFGSGDQFNRDAPSSAEKLEIDELEDFSSGESDSRHSGEFKFKSQPVYQSPEVEEVTIDHVEFHCGLFEGSVLSDCFSALDDYFARMPSGWEDDVYGDYFEDPATLREAALEFFQNEGCLRNSGPVDASLAEDCNVDLVSKYYQFMRICPRRSIEDQNDDTHFNTETYLASLAMVPGYTGEWRHTQQSINNTRDHIRQRYYLEGRFRVKCNQHPIEMALLHVVPTDMSFMEEYSLNERARVKDPDSDVFWDMAYAHDVAHSEVLLPSLARLGIKSLIDIYDGFDDDEYMDSLEDFYPLYVHDIGCKSFDATRTERLKSCLLAHYWSYATQEPKEIRLNYVRRYLFASSFELDQAIYELGNQLSEEFIGNVRASDAQSAIESAADGSTHLPHDVW